MAKLYVLQKIIGEMLTVASLRTVADRTRKRNLGNTSTTSKFLDSVLLFLNFAGFSFLLVLSLLRDYALRVFFSVISSHTSKISRRNVSFYKTTK